MDIAEAHRIAHSDTATEEERVGRDGKKRASPKPTPNRSGLPKQGKRVTEGQQSPTTKVQAESDDLRQLTPESGCQGGRSNSTGKREPEVEHDSQATNLVVEDAAAAEPEPTGSAPAQPLPETEDPEPSKASFSEGPELESAVTDWDSHGDIERLGGEAVETAWPEFAAAVKDLAQDHASKVCSKELREAGLTADDLAKQLLRKLQTARDLTLNTHSPSRG